MKADFTEIFANDHCRVVTLQYPLCRSSIRLTQVRTWWLCKPRLRLII